MNVRRTTQFLGCAVVVALVATACGSSGTKAEPAPSAATGTPILFGSFTSVSSPTFSQPTAKPVMEAAIAAINANGGIKGHPLKLEFCDTTFTAAGELSCARQMVDAKVMAVVAPNVLVDQSGAESKLFADAGIVEFATTGSSPTQNINTNSYLLGPGVGWLTGALKALKENGATKVALMADSNTTGQFVETLYTPGVTGLGLTNAGSVLGDPKADPTYGSTAAKVVATGANGVFVASGGFALAIKALQQAGYKGKIATASSLTTAAVLTALGSTGDGILVSNQTKFSSDVTDPDVKKFIDTMKQYAPSTTIDDSVLMRYAQTLLFAEVAKTMAGPDYTNTAFKTAVDNLSTPVNIGLIGPWSIKGKTSPVAAYPRILNPSVLIGTIKGGVITSNGKGFENPFV